MYHPGASFSLNQKIIRYLHVALNLKTVNNKTPKIKTKLGDLALLFQLLLFLLFSGSHLNKNVYSVNSFFFIVIFYD
jgi:hypothetical protein